MNKINLTEKHKEQVIKILQKHLSDLEVWAFGSRVNFTNQENSDLDLVIVAKEKQSLSKIAALKSVFEQSTLPFEIDLLDYQRLSPNMKKQIKKSYLVFWEGF